MFDCIIVCLAVADLTNSSVSESFDIDLWALTVLCLIRLARLTLLVRLLRLKAFKELLLMVKRHLHWRKDTCMGHRSVHVSDLLPWSFPQTDRRLSDLERLAQL